MFERGKLIGTFGLAVLSFGLLGVAPALQALIDRVEILEAEVERLASAPRPAVVFDASGAELGRLLDVDPSGRMSVYHEGLEATFRIDPLAVTPVREGPSQIFFDEPDCAGTAFLSGSSIGAGKLVVAGPNGGPNRIFVGTTNVLVLRTRSVLDTGIAPCKNAIGDTSGLEAVEVTVEDLGFDLPLTRPISFRSVE